MDIKQEKMAKKILIGFMIGVFTIGVMTYPFEVFVGVRIDTRSIIMALSGLFFGAIPTFVAVILASTYRIYLGGVGMMAGLVIIIISGGVGLVWRHFLYDQLTEKKLKHPWWNLYFMGIIVHFGMILSFFILGDLAWPVISRVFLPILVIFPLVTAYLGLMIRTQIVFRKQDLQLKISEEKYRNLVTEMSQGLAVHEMIYDKKGLAVDYRFIDINKSFSLMTGLLAENVIDRTVLEVMPETERYWIEKYDQVVKRQESIHFENYSKELDKYFEVTAYPIGGNQFAVMTYDTTERYYREQWIEYLSFHDQLTGLYNRRFFEEELNRLDVKRNLPISLIMADVNDLKLINDAFGHDMGDVLLKSVCDHFTAAVREDDIVARVGGDEFVLILPGADEHVALKLIQRINEGIEKLVIHDIFVSVSMGAATKTEVDEPIWKIYNIAEDNMYRNKMFEITKRKDNIIDTIMNTLYHKNKGEKEHAERVSDLCMRMGIALGFNKNQINELKTVGLLHDIGKIALDESILNKTGKLTLTEWKLMRGHSEIGFRILSSVNNLAGVSRYVLAHHERWDGTGYPEGLKGEDIPIFARIISLADAYDAMTCVRTYHDIRCKEETIEEIKKCSGTQFDPELVEIFINQVIADYEEGCE
jgi:diguanylate cyclase (GGDEF)-like protein